MWSACMDTLRQGQEWQLASSESWKVDIVIGHQPPHPSQMRKDMQISTSKFNQEIR